VNYIRLKDAQDVDIPFLLSIYRLPEISRFIHINEDNYWNYVTTGENVYYYKVYREESMVAAIHCELSEQVLFMDIVVFPEYRRQGIGSEILWDLQHGAVLSGFERVEVSIEESNTASLRLFEKMGFTPVSKEDELIQYTYRLE